jgi:predicted nucleotidyltransferase
MSTIYKTIIKIALVTILRIIDNNSISLYAQTFTKQTDISISGIFQGSVDWGDYDNDGDLDILLAGSGITKIYQNAGANKFIEQTNISIAGLNSTSAAWGDYDNDGDLDILLTGDPGVLNGMSKIYKNNGNNSFTEQTAISIKGVYNSSVAWGDYDNDGDLDILLTGLTLRGTGISKIYNNKGNNSFVEQTGISLTGVYGSSAAWGDCDNDGDLDILLTGNISSFNNVSKIYKNNGNNSFTEQMDISLTNISEGSVAWGDYDNDGDLDILLTGDTSPTNWIGISKVYKNNGNNNFTEQVDISLEGISLGSATWGDYNNDGDLDILLSGRTKELVSISKIYKNNGNNSFTEQTDISLTGLSLSNAAWGDYDNDGDLDILMTGHNGEMGVSTIYKNNAAIVNVIPNTLSDLTETINGNEVTFSWGIASDSNQNSGLNYNLYVYNMDSAFYSCSANAFKQADALNGKRLIAEIGNIQKNFYVLNLMAGNYVWSVHAIDATFSGGTFASEKSFSIVGVTISPSAKQIIEPNHNGNGLSVSETDVSSKREWKYSTNMGGPYISFTPAQTGVQYVPNFQIPGHYYIICESIINSNSYISNEVEIEIPYFTEQSEISLTGVYYSSITWGDYNNDGYLDILITGDTGSGRISKIYKNNGDNSFTEQTTISLIGVSKGSVALGDYDNDGDLDILLTGNTGSNKISKIYKNNGNDSFTEQTTISLREVDDSSVAWGDYDNDGDLDILLSGSHYSKIVKNNGNNSFVEQSDIPLTGIVYSSVAWGDYDNDGNLDALLCGQTDLGREVLELYRSNDGNSFTRQTGLSLLSGNFGDVEFGDYDNDGDLDILIGVESKIYKNNGDNSFTEKTFTSIRGMENVRWGDYDNDGDLDILATGSYYSKIYKNNGNDIFMEQLDIALTEVIVGSGAFADYDNDGDLDLLITGITYGSKKVSKVYRNNAHTKNTKPNSLTSLQENIRGNEITFSWNKGTDPNQKEGLNYNLYVYNLDSSIFSSPSQAFRQTEMLNGKRLIARIGNIQTNSHKLILPDGKYAWSVQSIDASFDGGAFSNEELFTVQYPASIEMKGIEIYPNPSRKTLYIDFGNNSIQQIRITSSTGVAVFHKTAVSQFEIIDTSELQKGLYFLSIQTKERMIVTKMIKD